MAGARELLYGRRSAADFDTSPPRVDLNIDDDLVLADVTLHYSLYELPSDVVVDLLPKSLHPTHPGVLAITFWRVPNSPVGPFVVATVGVACRAAIKPRHFVLASFTSTQAAAELLRSRFGCDPRVTAVEQRLYNDAAISSVAIDGDKVVEISTGLLRNISGSSAGLKISPQLNLARVGDSHQLVQTEVSYDFHRTQRGRGQLAITDRRVIGLPGHGRLWPIASSVASVEVTLQPVRFALDIDEPPESRPSRRLRPALSAPRGA